MPTVSWRSARNATLSLEPTPSVDDTSTGSWYPLGTRTNPAKAPMPPSTSGRKVAFASGAMRRTASSPASMSTPASRYVRGFIALDVEEVELGRGVRLDADLVGTGEAGVTEARGIAAGRLEHSLQGEIAERVGAEITADLLDVVAGPDQLLARGRVDAVVARPLDGRRRDPHVDLARTPPAQHPHDLAAPPAPPGPVVPHPPPACPAPPRPSGGVSPS